MLLGTITLIFEVYSFRNKWIFLITKLTVYTFSLFYKKTRTYFISYLIYYIQAYVYLIFLPIETGMIEVMKIHNAKY